MEYKFATERSSYAELASGQVLYSLPGHPAFPVRLASEVYQRCLAHLVKDASACTLYDPCCGAAYHLTVVAYLHWDSVARVLCSDVDEKAAQVAARNLGLLTPSGMDRRAREIAAMANLYGKASHRKALESAHRLLEQVTCLSNVRPLQTHVFQADATDSAALQTGLEGVQVDIVFTDFPCGLHPQWKGGAVDPLWSMLEALHTVLSTQSILAISSDQSQKLAHPGYRRLEKFQVGKRQVAILKPI